MQNLFRRYTKVNQLKNEGSVKNIQIRQLAVGEALTRGGIEARKSNKGVTYYANLMVGGQRIRRLLGREVDGFNLSRAKAAIGRIRVEAEDPEKGENLAKRKTLLLLFRDAAEEYITMLRKTGGNNIHQKHQQLRDHLTPFFGMTSVTKITTEQVDTYKNERLLAGGTKSTINSELAVLSHLYSKMKEWGRCMNQPFLCKKFKNQNNKIEVFSAEQCQLLLDSAKEDVDPFTYMFILLGLNTGMRHSEILSLRYEYINYDMTRIFLPETKTGARHQPFPKGLIALLQQHQSTLEEPNGWVFPANSKTGHRTYMKKQFARTVERAGLDVRRYTPHTMRHTAITRLIEDGTPLEVVRNVSGHKTLQMVMRYTHVSNSVVDNALDSVALC